MAYGRVIQALYYGPKKPSFKTESEDSAEDSSSCGSESRDRLDVLGSYGASQEGKPRKTTRRMCYNCDACHLELDCGKCDFCLDQTKFGGKNILRQKCRMRQCRLYSRFVSQGSKCGSQDSSDDYERSERERKSVKLRKLLHISLGLRRRSQDELNEDDECKPERTKMELPNSRQTTPTTPSKVSFKPLQSPPQHMHPHSGSRSQKELDDERMARRLENKRRWRMKQKLLLQSRQHTQLFPRKASDPSLKTQPQVVLNGRFKVKHLQVEGIRITFRDLFVKLHNLTESMEAQALNKKVRYLQLGDKRVHLRRQCVKLQNLKDMKEKDQALNKEALSPPPSTDIFQEGEGSHPVESECATVAPIGCPLNLSARPLESRESHLVVDNETITVAPIGCPLNLSARPLESRESHLVVDNESITVAPIGCPLNLSTRPLESKESQLVVDNESITVAPIGCPFNLSTRSLESKASKLVVDNERITVAPIGCPLNLSTRPLESKESQLVVDNERISVAPRSTPLLPRIDVLQGEGSNPADTEGMTKVESPSLVLATIFYKKMEIRKRKYRISTIKELIKTCNQELDPFVQDNHDNPERIQVYDTDFNEYVDVEMNTDEVKDKDRFLVYFKSKCQFTDCTNSSQVRITVSSSVQPVESPSLVLATIFYKKMEFRKRKYRISTIKELIATCHQELDPFVQDNHDDLERIQVYDTDFSEFVDVFMNTDEVKDKDRFLVYFNSKYQLADYTNSSQVQITESSSVHPSKPRQPPPSDIDDDLIQGTEEVEQDRHMPVITEIGSGGSCMAFSRRGDAR